MSPLEVLLAIVTGCLWLSKVATEWVLSLWDEL